MPFELREAFLYTGVPTSPIPHLPRLYTSSNPKPVTSAGEVDFDAARQFVENAIANKSTSIAVDIEAVLPKLDQRLIGQDGGPANHAEIDKYLDAIIAAYTYMKDLAPWLQIGWYGLQLRSYYIPVYWRDKGQNENDYIAWEAAHARWNYRYIGGSLVAGHPISRGFDVAFADVYNFFGPLDTHAPTYVRENLRVIKRTISQDRPLFAFVWPYFAAFAGLVYPAGYTASLLTNISANADGAVIWGGYQVSSTLACNYAPTTTTASTWRAITAGTLDVKVGGITFNLTSFNLSGITVDLGDENVHMANIAAYIQAKIRLAVTAYNDLVPTNAPEPGFSTGRLIALPTVTVTWSSATGKFIIATGSPSAAPYDNYYGRQVIVVGTGSVNTLMGTYSETITARSTDEFTSWVTNQPWFTEVMAVATSVPRPDPDPNTLDGIHGTVQPDVIDNPLDIH